MGPLQSRGFHLGKIKPLRKKGIFFTFIAITIMAVAIVVFVPSSDISIQQDLQAVKTRINTIDHYVSDLEYSYFEIVLRATAHKAILSLVYYINTTKSPLNNFDSVFQEVFTNGTINNVAIDSITGKKIMDNNSFANWSNVVIRAAKDTFNVNTTIFVNSVSISQTMPWSLEASLDLNFSVKSNVAEWNKNAVIVTTISIEGFNDPYYLLNTNGLYTNQIKKSTVEFNDWNISKVRDHLRNGTYVHLESSDAPSFLMRFTSTISNSSCCGIESLVNPNKISTSDQTESYVDYLFWVQTYKSRCSEIYNITNQQTGGGIWDEFRYFKLDYNHTIKYNISSFDAVRNC